MSGKVEIPKWAARALYVWAVVGTPWTHYHPIWDAIEQLRKVVEPPPRPQRKKRT